MYDKKENMVRTKTNQIKDGDIERAFQYFPILKKKEKPRMRCRGDTPIKAKD